MMSIALPSLAATSKTIGAPPLPKLVVHERAVTMDVKDEEVRKIMATMQKQCAVKNLVIDPDVQARGTFVFHALPCSTAFKVVFQSLGLRAVDYGNSVVTVGTPKR
jgi:type II secretory pathway component GspD/PulD (secretin)